MVLRNSKIYVNGLLNGTYAASAWNQIVVTSTAPINATSLQIGHTNAGYMTSGKLDDVRLYNRTLSLSEVTRLYDGGPGPAGWWKLDETSGSTGYDSSGNENNGTPVGISIASSTTQGKYGKAIDFGPVDDTSGISLGAPAWLNNGINSGLTISGWVYLHAASSTNTILSNVRNTAGAYKGYGMRITGTNKIVCELFDNANYALCFDGQIDDVRIYNYAITSAQIKLIYNENSAIRFGPLTGSP